MDLIEMDCNELPEECQEISTADVVFKTPMIIDRNKLCPMFVRSNCHLDSPDLNFTTESLPCSTQMKSRKTRLQTMLFTPGEVSSESLLSSSPESASSSVNMGASPDSGIGAEIFYCSVKDSTLGDYEGLAPLDSSTKYSSTEEVSSSSEQGERIYPVVESGHKPWQSTPVYPDSKNLRPSFPGSCDLEPSPTKRRKNSYRRSSRDLFHINGKKSALQFWDVLPSSSELPLLGRETVDFLYHLGKASIHQPALDTILGYLEPSDLCRACVVSHTWKNVIEGVPKAHQKKKEYLDRCNQIKENINQPMKKAEGGLPIRGQLIAIQNFNRTDVSVTESPRSPPVSPSKVRFNLYLKEGRKLESGISLVQCPQCKLPSRRETERSATCTRHGCQYHFCILCLCKFHGDRACPVSSIRHRKRPTAIGSRESKRNLQRLCK